MQQKFEKVSEYNDLLCYVILKAPDRFPVDTGRTLESVFSDLRENTPILSKRIKDKSRLSVLSEMLEIAYEAYENNEQKKAIYTLQELQGIIWPKFEMESKYEPEAIQRLSNKNA